jgi:hypothetical protein
VCVPVFHGTVLEHNYLKSVFHQSMKLKKMHDSSMRRKGGPVGRDRRFRTRRVGDPSVVSAAVQWPEAPGNKLSWPAAGMTYLGKPWVMSAWVKDKRSTWSLEQVHGTTGPGLQGQGAGLHHLLPI